MNKNRFKEFFVNVPGGQVYVKKWIPDNIQDLAPVLLLHDSLGCIDLWRKFPDNLSRYLSRTVIAYDRLGFGKSSERNDQPSKDFIWEEADVYFPKIKKELLINKYILFGHSVGGGMALAIAAQDNSCLAVITESSQAFVEDATVAGIQKAKQKFEQPAQIEKLKKWHGKKARWVLQAWTDTWLSPEFASWSLQPCIHKVQCPVLAIHGDSDEYGTTASPEYIRNNVGGHSEMTLIKKCGHFPHRSKQQEVIEVAYSFITRYHIH